MCEMLVRPLASTDLPEVVDLFIAQKSRLSQLDARLDPYPSSDYIETSLTQECNNLQNPSFVVQNQSGHIRGYVQPSIYQLPSESALLTFFTSRNGTFHQLILPKPTDVDAIPVTSTLIRALSKCWQEQHTLADLFLWPSYDRWLEALLLKNGFLADGILAYRSAQLHFPTRSPSPFQFSIRQALPKDEEELVQLHLAEVAFHLPYTPFVRMTPNLEREFREKLSLLWSQKSLEDGAPLVLVVDIEGDIVAMAETYLQIIDKNNSHRRLPPGRYGYFNSVSVREDVRGKGIGHTLVQAVFNSHDSLSLDGYTLWFNSANPLSGPFWSSIGFLPLWTRYTRLAAMQT